MGLTIIGPIDVPFPAEIAAALVDVRQAWADDWDYRPEIDFAAGSAGIGGQGIGQVELRYRYGLTVRPYEAAYATVKPLDLLGWWVRIRIAGAQGVQTVWVGRITGETRRLYGSGTTRSGEQVFTAQEPLHLLEKIHVSQSWWNNDLTTFAIDWPPTFNRRDEANIEVGNRTTAKIVHPDPGGLSTYLFGGTSVWTREQMLEYVLVRFVDESGSSGPKWTYGGQADLLADITDSVEMDATQTAAELLGKIIDPRYGIDYRIVPVLDGDNVEGFSVEVFALAAEAAVFGGAKLPKNPNTVKIKASQTIDNITTEIIRTHDRRFGKIRVIGERVVSCFSLSFGESSLEAKWSAALETAYEAGTGVGADSVEAHDAAQASDRFRAVYQAFGPPMTWNFAGGKDPLLDANGTVLPYDITQQGGGAGAGIASSQMRIRRTLDWLPLREGFDYSKDPAVDENDNDRYPDLLPPAAWAYDDLLQRWLTLDKQGIGIAVSAAGIGVQFSAQPNHLLGKNHLAASAEGSQLPILDYAQMHVTIAVETDERLILEHDLDPAGSGPHDGVMDIMVAGAHCWVLSPHTVVGVDAAGKLQKSGDSRRVLRNDNARLALVMAGAIARYQSERNRAVVVVAGLHPWQGLLGQVLTVVEDGGDSHEIQAPITSIEWFNDPKSPTTTIRTGYAS